MEKETRYELQRSRKRKKTISLQVRRDGTVVIQAPLRTPQSEIERLIAEKSRWLRKRIQEQQERDGGKKSFAGGESFLYLGHSYPLVILDTRGDSRQAAPLTFSGQRFLLRGDHAAGAGSLFTAWYRERAGEHIPARVGHFSTALGSFPRSVRISNAACRWGSCSADNRLFFTWRLIMAPPPVIDYVILHEFAHLDEKNHSRRFWDLVEAALPDYEKYRLWLREKGHLLTL
jgi:predicted metal-dependent hydrolase